MNKSSSGTKLNLPSANSAFKRLEMRADIAPTSPRCVNLFNTDGRAVKDMLNEEMQRQQMAFQIRWTCRCDAMSKPRLDNSPTFRATRTPQTFNWRPIGQMKEDVPCLLKRFALAKISVENIDTDSSHSSQQKIKCDRPKSPIPFRLARLEHNAGEPSDSAGTPSLFHLNRNDVAMTACEEDLEIVAASAAKEGDIHAMTTLTPCLTPPQSPLKNPEISRYKLRNRQRQTKLNEWYQPRKAASLPKTRHKSGCKRVRPRSILTNDGDNSQRSLTSAKKNFVQNNSFHDEGRYFGQRVALQRAFIRHKVQPLSFQ